MGITVNVRPKSDISVLELTGVINREVKQKRLERTRDSLKRMYNMDYANKLVDKLIEHNGKQYKESNSYARD